MPSCISTEPASVKRKNLKAENQEHGDQDALEENIEDEEIEGAEHADHEGLEDQKGDHVLLHPHLDRVPAGQDADRRQQSRQEHEGHRDAVHAEAIGDAEFGDPIGLLDELERRGSALEAKPDEQRQHEGRQRGPERHHAGVARHVLGLAADDQDKRRAHQGHEGNQAQQGRVAHRHRLTPDRQ
jgi:hypothetical protein